METKCSYIEDISDVESCCKKGFPIDSTCFNGQNNSCPYYSNFYDPVREDNPQLAHDIDQKLNELAVEDIILNIKNEPRGSFFNP